MQRFQEYMSKFPFIKTNNINHLHLSIQQQNSKENNSYNSKLTDYPTGRDQKQNRVSYNEILQCQWQIQCFNRITVMWYSACRSQFTC